MVPARHDKNRERAAGAADDQGWKTTLTTPSSFFWKRS